MIKELMAKHSKTPERKRDSFKTPKPKSIPKLKPTPKRKPTPKAKKVAEEKYEFFSNL